MGSQQSCSLSNFETNVAEKNPKKVFKTADQRGSSSEGSIDTFKSSIISELKTNLSAEILQEIKEYISVLISAKIKQETTHQITQCKILLTNNINDHAQKQSLELARLKADWEKKMATLFNNQSALTECYKGFDFQRIEKYKQDVDEFKAGYDRLLRESKSDADQKLSQVKTNLMLVQNELNSKIDILENKLWDKLIALDGLSKKLAENEKKSTQTTEKSPGEKAMPDPAYFYIKSASIDDSFFTELQNLNMVPENRNNSLDRLHSVNRVEEEQFANVNNFKKRNTISRPGQNVQQTIATKTKVQTSPVQPLVLGQTSTSAFVPKSDIGAPSAGKSKLKTSYSGNSIGAQAAKIEILDQIPKLENKIAMKSFLSINAKEPVKESTQEMENKIIATFDEFKSLSPPPLKPSSPFTQAFLGQR